MKKYIFQLELNDTDLAVTGNEFWEDIIAKDSTGITGLTEELEAMLIDSNIIQQDLVSSCLKLISYEDI